jgi:hypothetical protein
MWFSSWLGKRLRAAPGRPSHVSPRKRSPYRPRLEALEDRTVPSGGHKPSTWTVTTTADSGPGSLRADIAAAASGDTINFAPSLDGQTITLTSGELVINKNLTVKGPGQGQLTISGDYQPSYPPTGSRVFEVDGGITATISGLTISNGFVEYNTGGGGILNYGNLTVSGCTLSGNVANFGGAIDNNGTLTVSGCTLSDNQFTNQSGQMGGGGLYNANAARATVTASTITGNSGPPVIGNTDDPSMYGDGGGIYNGGWMTLSGTTVTDNTPYELGGGIYEDLYASLSILNKSVVANNTSGGDLFLANPYSSVTISSDSHVGTIFR